MEGYKEFNKRNAEKTRIELKKLANKHKLSKFFAFDRGEIVTHWVDGECHQSKIMSRSYNLEEREDGEFQEVVIYHVMDIKSGIRKAILEHQCQLFVRSQPQTLLSKQPKSS